LPAGVTVLFLLWQRQLRRLLDRRLVEGVLVFVLVAAPWYILVTAETKGVFLREFVGTHNLGRVITSMEAHSGSPLYYVLVLFVGLVPWTSFLALPVWYAWRQARSGDGEERDCVRFLVCWCAVYFVFFSIVRTKLPNYILPLYPAVALLTARVL